MIEFTIGIRKIPFLKDIRPQLAPSPPRVSILIPARNEAPKIEEALQSVLLQDYPNFEVITINYRSTDRTGNILDHLASQHPHLKVIHIADLPSGWLCKNHALYIGSQHATGEVQCYWRP
jgi:cellulose synthase/poly-beta-1,6-N-acetylglucosamine synthase-like glycosyltransferase